MGDSRTQIIAAVKNNQPPYSALPVYSTFPHTTDNLAMFTSVLTAIGASIYNVKDHTEIISIITGIFGNENRVIATNSALSPIAETPANYKDPHELADVDVAIIDSSIAVAENGAVWITEHELPNRVLPFITQHLAVVVKKENIVPTMQDAYHIIGNAEYSYGTFIAGPSKTADIEQSLVLGAHGPRSMMVFIL